jgi:hypothetical protein
MPAAAVPAASVPGPGAAPLGSAGHGWQGPGSCGEPSAPCGPEGAVWASAEYLFLFLKNGHVPPLVSVGPASSAGILGNGAVTAFGPGSDLVGQDRSAARFTVGGWLDEDHLWGVEGSGFFLPSSNKNIRFAGDGSPGSQAIGRPFFNPLLMAEDAEAVATPGSLAGAVGVSTSSELWGAGANLVCNVCCDCSYRVDALVGFQYLNLDERLTVTENLAVLPGVPVIGGTRFDIIDQFQTNSHFYGGQIGARVEHSWCGWYARVSGLLGVGVVSESVDVFGATRTTSPTGAVTAQPGGLLALRSNIGHYERDQFAVVPQGSVMLGYQVTSNLRAWVGYTFLYCSNVVRPGDQIDRVVNPTLLPSSSGLVPPVPPNRPAFTFRDSDFWVQGITAGVELRF